VVLRRSGRRNADEPGPAGVVRGAVPGGLEELVRAHERAARVVRRVIAATLAGARAHEERMVVLRVHARGRHVAGWRRRWRRLGGGGRRSRRVRSRRGRFGWWRSAVGGGRPRDGRRRDRRCGGRGGRGLTLLLGVGEESVDLVALGFHIRQRALRVV